MPRALTMLAVIILSCCALRASACGGYDEAELQADVTHVLGHDGEAPAAIARLRAYGRVVLPLLDMEHSRRADAGPVDEADWDALYDQVGQQRGCRISRLFWYTDLEQAERVAATEGKPILSLRLLGRLTDEYSCANSRFFRTILYANQAVSDRLREDVVLHWSSERPVPQVTIDFGDGRLLRTTVTGNSIHYLLDAEGRPVDALPGLYGPAPFLERLSRAMALELALRDDPAGREQALAGWHERAAAETRAEWRASTALGIVPGADAPEGIQAIDFEPEAMDAEALTMVKCVVERPLLNATRQGGVGRVRPLPPEAVARVAGNRPESGAIDGTSRALIEAQLRAVGASGIDMVIDVGAAVSELERSIAQDTVIGEYSLHLAIHRRFAAGDAGGFAELNRWVYDRVFLTPASDPWLGLLPRAYAGLDRNGIVAAGAAR